MDIDKIPVHKPPSENEVIPFSTKPISKEEYFEFIEKIRNDPYFDRLPQPAWVYEELPEYAETSKQTVGVNVEFTEKILRASEKKDLEAEKKATEEKIARLKKLAKKNKAIRKAKQRLTDIAARLEELKIDDDDPDLQIKIDDTFSATEKISNIVE